MGIPGPHFRRRRGGVEWRLSRVERTLVDDLRRQLVTLLTATPDADEATDAVHARLFPSAVDGDDVADAELRAMLHDDLLARRLSGLDAVEALLAEAKERKDGGVRVLLDDEGCAIVLGVLNDVRLAIGARIGVADIDRDDPPDDPARTAGLEVMDYLGWMQEQLLEQMVGPLDLDLDDDVTR